MKVWASLTAAGFGMAYLAACSSSPSDDGNHYVAGGAAGSSAAGAPSAGAAPVGGSASGGMPAATAGTGGTATSSAGAPAGGMPATGGMTATAGAGGGGTAGSGGGSCPTGVTGHCDPGATYPTYTDYTLNLVEDFPAALDLNNDPVWTWSDGSPQDGQTGFAEGAITFADGKMNITASVGTGANCSPRANGTCYPPRNSYGESYSTMVPRGIGAMGVQSGELRTKYNNYRYGRYEVALKAPDQPMGNYLSTMFVFRTPKDVDWNEVDIEIEPNMQGAVNGNVVNPPASARPHTSYPGGANFTTPISGLMIGAQHIYAFTWTSAGINWYLDNSTTPFHSYTGTTPPVPNLATKVMMNLWVFASSAAFGDPTKNTYPMVAQYDWFHFYKWNQETTYPCSPTPACLNKTNGDYTAASQNNPKEMNYGK